MNLKQMLNSIIQLNRIKNFTISLKIAKYSHYYKSLLKHLQLAGCSNTFKCLFCVILNKDKKEKVIIRKGGYYRENFGKTDKKLKPAGLYIAS